MYDEGKGVAENNQQAIHWYTLVAERDDKNAQHNLNSVYGEKEDPISSVLEFLLNRKFPCEFSLGQNSSKLKITKVARR